MATTKNNVIVKGASGKFGRQIVFSQRAGKTIMSKPPLAHCTLHHQTKRTASQIRPCSHLCQKRPFRPHPKRSQAYTTEAKKRQDVSPYTMAMTDYLRPPQITHVDHSAYSGDASGEKIFIEAADAFKITTMKVKITAANSSTLEEGNASMVNGKWEYTTTATNTTLTGSKITLTATDRPGNTTTKEITL